MAPNKHHAPRKGDHRDVYDYLSELRYIDDGNPNCFDPEPLPQSGHRSEEELMVKVRLPLEPAADDSTLVGAVAPGLGRRT